MSASTLVIAGCVGGFLLVAVWPWVSAYLERRDVPARLLDAMREEWEREGEGSREPWNW